MLVTRGDGSPPDKARRRNSVAVQGPDFCAANATGGLARHRAHTSQRLGGWNLTRIAAAYVGYAALETALKIRSVHEPLESVQTAVISPELRKRLVFYSGQAFT